MNLQELRYVETEDRMVLREKFEEEEDGDEEVRQ